MIGSAVPFFQRIKSHQSVGVGFDQDKFPANKHFFPVGFIFENGGDEFHDRVGQITMRVDETKTAARENVLSDKRQQASRLAGPGRSGQIGMRIYVLNGEMNFLSFVPVIERLGVSYIQGIRKRLFFFGKRKSFRDSNILIRSFSRNAIIIGSSFRLPIFFGPFGNITNFFLVLPRGYHGRRGLTG